MSILKSRQIYVGGFDKEYFVDEMSNSHLINSIRQIVDNIAALDVAGAMHGTKGGIHHAINCLHKDLKVLSKELDRRKTCKEDC